MFENQDTICALATPSCIVAIGMIRLSGDKSYEITSKIFSKNLTNANQYINIDACQQVSITDNVAWNSSTVLYGVAIGNASDRYFITDNMFEATLGTINDYSTGTPLKTVNNNLQT